MKQTFMKKVMILFVLLAMVSLGTFAQEFSLDDDPSNPATGPFVPGFGCAEDEFGIGISAFPGPSPSLFMGFLDSDVLMPGPGLSMRFMPAPILPPISPALSPSPYFVDAYSLDHSMLCWSDYPFIQLRFSIDRTSGGRTPADATYTQAANLDHPADIFQSTSSFTHPAAFIPLPAPAAPPWFAVFGGLLPTAGGGGSNTLIYDNSFFGLMANPPMAPFSHDNINAYSEFPNPTMQNQDVYFALPPAEAISRGLSPSDIYYSPPGPIFLTPPYAAGWQIGLTVNNSIDALIVWDYAGLGTCDPGVDFALFSLAPGSVTLAAVNNLLLSMGFNGADGASVFLTDFNGYFYLYAESGDLGVGNLPVPPLAPQTIDFVNIDALEMR